MKDKPLYENEQQIKIKLSEIEKEITAAYAEIDFYKKKIESVKNKLEFKMNLEKAVSLENLVNIENSRNKELRQEYESLVKLNNQQTKKLGNLDSENKYKEKIEVLKTEIKNMKESIKEASEKYIKQERFLKLMHEKIAYIESQAKKLSSTKLEQVKRFTKEKLKDVLGNINQLRCNIQQKREELKNSGKINEEKLNKIKFECKNLDDNYNDQVKVNKMLVFRRNELKRLVKMLSENKTQKFSKLDYNNIMKIVNNYSSNTINNNDISKEEIPNNNKNIDNNNSQVSAEN